MTLRLDLLARVVLAPAWAAWMFGRYAWEFPRRGGIMVGGGAVVYGLCVLLGLRDAAGLIVDVALVAGVVVLARPAWRRWVLHRARCRWVQWRVYERDGRWTAAMKAAGLSAVRPRARDEHPPIVRCEVDGYGHTLWVNKLYGHTVEQWQRQAESLRQAFGARSVRVFEDQHPLYRVELARGPDPLEDTIAALPIPESADDVDFSTVPIGLTERGRPWTLDVRLHILLAGKSKAGKSSALWSLIRSLAPAVRDGLVELRGIDPKGGIELGYGEELFAVYEDKDVQAMSVLLADAVTEMHSRLRRIKREGLVRLHTPSLKEPLVLLVIDEFATVSDYVGTDQASRQLANVMKANIRTLLNQGRAAGFVMIGALQDPRIEVLPMRNSFPYRVGFRMQTPDETEMVLEDRHAGCDEISISTPGVAFMLVEGQSEFVRCRAAYVTDAEIREMAVAYAPQAKAAVIDPKVAAVLGKTPGSST